MSDIDNQEVREADEAAALGDSKGRNPGQGAVKFGSALIVFVLGIGAGILLTFSGHGLFAGHLSVVLTGFLIALFCVAIFGLFVFALRRHILGYLFQVTNTQLEQIAGPLASVARHAVQRDPDGAVDAARSFAQVALARWAWLSTRRWIIASLTALIASLAALAGTALLFRQNELLAEQSVLLQQQIERLDEQNAMIDTDIQLAEAARSAALLSEIGTVADLLGQATEELNKAGNGGPYDPASDLPEGLVNRIVTVSLAARPYRYLDVATPISNPRLAYQASVSRRPDLPELAAAYGHPDADGKTRLIDLPVSPERGQLLAMLYNSSVIKTEPISFRGADFSFAQVRIPVLALASYQFATLSQADFRGITIVESRFRAASLYKATFTGAIINRSDFSAIPGDQIEPPHGKREDPARTALTGADFGSTAVIATSFAGTDAQLVSYDRALLADVSFAGTVLAASTFRETVFVDVDFTGADLRAVDLSGAFVFSETFIDDLNAAAAPETFNPDRWKLEKATLEDVYEVDMAFEHLGVEVDMARIEGRQPWRIVRVGEF